MKIALCLLATLIGLANVTRDAAACSCMGSSLAQQLENADYAFAGTVVKISRGRGASTSNLIIATMAVEEVWKGHVTTEFKVATWMSGAACGYEALKAGGKFVLFAFDPSGDVDHVFTTACTRNNTYAEAEKDLAKLGPGFPPSRIVDGMPSDVTLGSPHPHPTNSIATMNLFVHRSQRVNVEVYSTIGRRIATLYDGPVQTDVPRSISFETASLPPGLYLVRATGEAFSQTRKVLVVR